MLHLKTENDILAMRKAGLLTWCGHKLVSEIIKAGMTTRDLDHEVETLFVKNGAVPIFKGVNGRVPYPASTCISINEQVVHGIPGDRLIQDGDLVSVDTGCRLNSWCGDSANTYPVGQVDSTGLKLIEVTRSVLAHAIQHLSRAKKWSEVASEMDKIVRKNGFSTVEEFVGHGIGHEMHESPQVPNFVYREYMRHGDFMIRPGVVIAIEPMVNEGTKKVRSSRDYWTMLTADGKRSAHVEHTIGILKSGPIVLTGPPQTDEENEQVKVFFEKYRT